MSWPVVTLILGLVLGTAVLLFAAALVLGIITEMRKARTLEADRAVARAALRARGTRGRTTL